MPMSLVFSLTIAQKIARTRKTAVSEMIPNRNSVSAISFSIAPIMVRLRSFQVTMRSR